MMTSYFSKNAKNPGAVSIALKSPDWFHGREYKDLAPKYWFLKKYKEDGDEEFYRSQYFEEVLGRLDPKKVFEDLGEDAVLLCWEKSGSFCHRRLAAEWLEKALGIVIKESV